MQRSRNPLDFNITGFWRDNYENGKPGESSGTLLRNYPCDDVVGFKASLVEAMAIVPR